MLTLNEEADPLFSDENEPFSETEDDLGTPTVFDAVVVSTDWTTETILSQIARNKLELTPQFQRRDAWDRRKKSRFVESLIVGLPIPQIVLAERMGRRGEFIVLDGKQRLLSLQQFTNDSAGFRLTGLDLRPELNGRTYQELPSSDRDALDTQTVRTIVVRNWQQEEFLYLVFLRLNTESVSLSPQELRQALHPGEFVSFVNKYTAENFEFYSLFRRKVPDFRMRDVELLVRYFAFRSFLPRYRGNLKPLLDLTCQELNERWNSEEVEIQRAADNCRSAIAATLEIFGRNAFRRWNGEEFEQPFNRAVFDIMTFYASDGEIRNRMILDADAVVEAFKTLCLDPTFAEAITTTTKSITAIVGRLSLWGNILRSSLNIPIPTPSIDGGKIAYARA